MSSNIVEIEEGGERDNADLQDEGLAPENIVEHEGEHEDEYQPIATIKPFVAIVGRPNVGKSTLFNRLTRSRDAIVDDRPGVTRDRMVGIGRVGEQPYWVIDTGGIEADKEELHGLMKYQVSAALESCEAVIFIVDGREGATPTDFEIAKQLRNNKKRKLFLAVNKAEGLERGMVEADFYQLGLGEPHAISGKNGDGITKMMNIVLDQLEVSERNLSEELGLPDNVPAISVIGRPNVGKSTMVNSLVGEERVVVYDEPGTTRDSIDVPVTISGNDYVLVDTAGMRKKSKIDDRVERFSVMKSVKAIERSQLCLVMLDARAGVVEQDSRLISLVLNSGRSMILLINKWDDMSEYDRERAKASIDKRLPYLKNVPMLFTSAKKGKGFKELPKLINKVMASAMINMSTGELNRIIQRCSVQRTPPMIGIRSIKMKFAHQGGVNPPHVIIHGNMLDKLPQTYLRFITNSIEQEFKLVGTRVRLSFRVSDNPYDSKEQI